MVGRGQNTGFTSSSKVNDTRLEGSVWPPFSGYCYGSIGYFKGMLHATISSSLYQLTVHSFIKKMLTEMYSQATLNGTWTRLQQFSGFHAQEYLLSSTNPCSPGVREDHWACAVQCTSQGKRLLSYTAIILSFTLNFTWPQMFTHVHLRVVCYCLLYTTSNLNPHLEYLISQ